MNVVQLTQKLISIPSFVDGKTDETPLGDFVVDYLKSYCPWLTIQKQKVGNNRWNVIATDGNYPKLLLVAHMDTVEPKAQNRFDPFTGIIRGNHLYGLGAVDMKGGLAAILTAIASSSKTNGLMALFYVDEEYAFAGIQAFVKKYRRAPQLVVSAEPTDLKLSNGCRGITEFSYEVVGKTGHAATPNTGINAIEKAYAISEKLKKICASFGNAQLGRSTLNLAYIRGGLNKGRSNNALVVGNLGMNIPDIAEVTQEIRLADADLTWDAIGSVLQTEAKKQNVRIDNLSYKFFLKPFYTDQKLLQPLEKAIVQAGLKTSYRKAQTVGYYDIGLLAQNWNVPCATFGPGPRDRSHAGNEYVFINTLYQTQKVYQNLIRIICS